MRSDTRGHWIKSTLVLLGCLLVAGCSTGQGAPDAQERLAKAKAIFEQRCLTAGEKIHRTVDNVEGISLLKVRPLAVNYADQFELTDPYGQDAGGDAYIMSFLKGDHQRLHLGQQADTSSSRGYLYVEVVDPSDTKRYRFTGAIKEVEVVSSPLVGGSGSKVKTTTFVLNKALAIGTAPRYGVTYDDISTQEEREFWIAGSSLKVIDLQSSEVIAERVGYMLDVHQGSRAGGRSPWLLAAANSCPQFRGRHPTTDQSWQTKRFVEKVLRPSQQQGEK